MPISDKPFNNHDALLADDPAVARLYLPVNPNRCGCDDCDCGNAVPANQQVCIQCCNGQHEDGK